MREEAEVLQGVRGLSRRKLRAWVQAGWVFPARGEQGAMYSDIDIARVHLIHHLQADLNIGTDALPVVLSLVDQVYGLRRELRRLARAVEAQPDRVKRAILRTNDQG